MSVTHQFDVATLAGLTQQWVEAVSCDDHDGAQRLAVQVIDSLLGSFTGSSSRFVAPTLHPGIYFSSPQGHALIVDTTRDAVVMNRRDGVSVADVTITDWDQLARLGRYLVMLAERHRTAAADTVDATAAVPVPPHVRHRSRSRRPASGRTRRA